MIPHEPGSSEPRESKMLSQVRRWRAEAHEQMKSGTIDIEMLCREFGLTPPVMHTSTTPSKKPA